MGVGASVFEQVVAEDEMGARHCEHCEGGAHWRFSEDGVDDRSRSQSKKPFVGCDVIVHLAGATTRVTRYYRLRTTG